MMAKQVEVITNISLKTCCSTDDRLLTNQTLFGGGVDLGETKHVISSKRRIG